MASVNKVILIGNVGNDPDIRATPSGETIANFSVATTDQWKDKAGAKQERTEWHRVVCFRKLGEIVESYVKKGTSIYVEGRIQSEKYTDKNGVEKLSFQVIADQIRLLGSSNGNQEKPAQGAKKPVADGNFDTMEDDIPF